MRRECKMLHQNTNHQKEHLLVSRTIHLQPGRRLRRECGDRVRVGLDDYVLDDLLFFGVEDFG